MLVFAAWAARLFREHFTSVLGVGDVQRLAHDIGYCGFDDVIIRNIVELVEAVVPIDLSEPSYCRVSDSNTGTVWHDDHGTKKHMAWCDYSASMLLTPSSDFTGGGLYFDDAPDLAIHHFNELIVWSNDDVCNRHYVAKSRGSRIVLLMFFQGGETDGRRD